MPQFWQLSKRPNFLFLPLKSLLCFRQEKLWCEHCCFLHWQWFHVTCPYPTFQTCLHVQIVTNCWHFIACSLLCGLSVRPPNTLQQFQCFFEQTFKRMALHWDGNKANNALWTTGRVSVRFSSITLWVAPTSPLTLDHREPQPLVISWGEVASNQGRMTNPSLTVAHSNSE